MEQNKQSHGKRKMMSKANEQLAEKQKWNKIHRDTTDEIYYRNWHRQKLILAISFLFIVVINFVKNEKRTHKKNRWRFNWSKMQTTWETFPFICVCTHYQKSSIYFIHKTYALSHTHHHLIRLTLDAVFLRCSSLWCIWCLMYFGCSIAS